MIKDLIKLVLFTYFKRVPYFNSKKKKVQRKFEENRGMRIDIECVTFSWFHVLNISNLNVSDQLGTYSLFIECTVCKIDIRGLFSKKFQIKHLKLSNCRTHYHKKRNETERKYSAPSPDVEINPQFIIRNFYEKIYKKSEMLFYKFPEHAELNNFDVKYNQLAYNFEKCDIKNTFVELEDEPEKGGMLNVSFLKTRVNLPELNGDSCNEISVGKITLKLAEHRLKGNLIAYDLKGESENTDIKIKNICDHHLTGQQFYFDLKSIRTGVGLFFDESSKIRFNGLTFEVLYKHLFDDPDRIEIGLKLKRCSMKDILESFPLFQHKALYHADFSGYFSFSASLDVTFSRPTHTNFAIHTDHTLRLENYDALDLSFLKKPFTHAIQDEGNAHKIVLDFHNESFMPLERISENLKKVVLCTEDPNYFQHTGLDNEGVFRALFTNISTGKLSRGASTITMQLAKNLFLNNRKSVYRKAEELIFTWLIEEVFMIGKDRLLEIYLNIIEFGDHIYGVQEAAVYYFNKNADSLSITESIVLSYIIPRPKFFEEALVGNSEQLRVNLKKHLEYFSKLLLEKDIITKDVYDEVDLNIVFAPALGMLDLSDANPF